MGAVTPLADNLAKLFRSQLEGQSGVRRIQHFDARWFPTQIAAQVLNYDLRKYLPEADATRFQDAGPNCKFAVVAARQAMEQAGLLNNDKVDRSRLGIYLGTGEGQQDFKAFISLIGRTYLPDRGKIDARRFAELGRKELHAGLECEQEPHTTCGHLADYLHCEGPNYNCLTACAASSQAIGEATEMIRRGEADMMLSGGSHSMIHPLGVTGFNLLTALSTHNADPEKASRPFDLTRDGFILGEGAGMVMLEELEHAKARGAEIFAEVTGYGSTADAFRVTDSHEDGRGAIACIRGALNDAGLKPEDIDYINAHGTSTKVNDRVETIAIKKVLGGHAYKTPVSSSKSMLGHLIAAAGAVELIICAMVLKHDVIPPTINYQTPDPDCDLDYVPNVPREKRCRHVLSNSFGFGGQNISLVVSRL
jgi:3-oxoacyl-[acyl-carrier-protein] synthase II